MWQTAFHIPLEVAGAPMFGVGLLLGLWAVFCAGLLVCLVRRQGFNADTVSYLPVMLLVAAVIVWLLPALCDAQGLPIHGYGILMLLAVTSAMGLALWRGKRAGLSSELIYSFVLWLIVPGIIAARAFYVIEYWSTQYWPVYQQEGGKALAWAVVNIAQGGLVVYGGIIAGLLGLLAFSHLHKLPALAMADLIAPSMALGLAFGRIGCLMTGCCYGSQCDLPWAIRFPAGSPAYSTQVQQGEMYGFAVSNDPLAAPALLAVKADSPAGRAGLKPGEVLEKIDGIAVRTAGEAYEAIWNDYQRERPLRLETREGKSVALPAQAIASRSLPVHPTQIYSAIDALLICMLALAAEKFLRRDGEVFALSIGIYAVTRFLVEMLRTDEAHVFGTGMTIAQNISLAMLVLSAGLWIYLLCRPAGKAFWAAGAPA